MTAAWTTSKLRDVADIRVSNVDKKAYATERPIKLCNYMDVYANDYVTSALDFMSATASPSEIERFALHAGDVVITKDSETPDDIGVPAVIVDEVDGLVCGYHLALLRPKMSVHPNFLAKQLASAPISKYFAANATGSTRFGLTIGTIEKLDIPTPPIREQAKIAEVLSTVDRALEQTEALIAKQQRIKTGLMQDLLTRGIDEHGNLRSEQTHEFKNSPLGRIPVEWAAAGLSTRKHGKKPYLKTGPFGSSLKISDWVEHGIPVITIGALGEGSFEEGDLLYISAEKAERLAAYALEPGDIVFSRVADVGRSVVVTERERGWIMSSNMMRISIDVAKADPNFLRLNIVKHPGVRAQIRQTVNASGREVANQQVLDALRFPWPSVDEQRRIVRTVAQQSEQIARDEVRLAKLRHVKAGLMQDLLTGNRSVTELLEPDGVTV